MVKKKFNSLISYPGKLSNLNTVERKIKNKIRMLKEQR